MKELVVISGKGGTGKTSIVAALAALANNKVLADCDVDAADLHLVLEPEIKLREDFSGGKIASVEVDRCIGCGQCLEVCRFKAVAPDGPCNEKGQFTHEIDPIACEGCGVCVWNCPVKAIKFESKVNGEIYTSQTRHGAMVHARLGAAEENSGKLVTEVRKKAVAMAAKEGVELVIIDGSPGVGCPVIASITGASLILVVTEPTQSGMHDMLRVLDLAEGFKIPSMVVVNKSDLNADVVRLMEEELSKRDIPIIGQVPYDDDFTRAQLEMKSVVEYSDSKASSEIRSIWQRIEERLNA